MKNIDMFNLTVSEILGQCYKNFPNETDFDYRQIAHQVSQYYDKSDYQENFVILEGICRDTMSWLYQADYLWTRFPVHSQRATMNATGIRLSPKGLEALSLMPDSLTQKKPVGDILQGGVKETGKMAALEAVKFILSEGVKIYSQP
ncbi:hypothetical protein ACRWQL_00145 (plasmid) [Shewanella sp. HL-SH4]|uniref:hypothetical protein n=1 Tax=Shewanella sp. HL-SH4 TaxID=3436240 RepID=UPI003EBE41AA